MVEQGKKGSKIVIVSSLLALTSFAGYSAYAPAKYALRGEPDLHPSPQVVPSRVVVCICKIVWRKTGIPTLFSFPAQYVSRSVRLLLNTAANNFPISFLPRPRGDAPLRVPSIRHRHPSLPPCWNLFSRLRNRKFDQA